MASSRVRSMGAALATPVGILPSSGLLLAPTGDGAGETAGAGSVVRCGAGEPVRVVCPLHKEAQIVVVARMPNNFINAPFQPVRRGAAAS